MYACAAEDRYARLLGGEALWQHGKRWILTGRHSPRQGQRSARWGSLAENSSIIAGMERPTGGPGTRCGVRRRFKLYFRSCSTATHGAEIVELPVCGLRAFLQVPSSPSSWTQTGGVQRGMPLVREPCSECRRRHPGKPEEVMWGCRRYACCPAGAVDTNTLNGECELEHESGLADHGLLDGVNDRDDAPKGLR